MIRDNLLTCLVFATFSLCATTNATACRNPSHETHTFLDFLPIFAKDEALIALVEIKEPIRFRDRHAVSVKVVKAMSGAAPGQTIKVAKVLHSCSRDARVANGELYFIAGAIEEDGLFYGDWANVPSHYAGHQPQPKKRPWSEPRAYME